MNVGESWFGSITGVCAVVFASCTSALPCTVIVGLYFTVDTSWSRPYAASVAFWLSAISPRSSVAALGDSRKWYSNAGQAVPIADGGDQHQRRGRPAITRTRLARNALATSATAARIASDISTYLPGSAACTSVYEAPVTGPRDDVVKEYRDSQ